MSKTQKAFERMWRDPVIRARLIAKFWRNMDCAIGHGPKGECWVWTRARLKKKKGGGYGITSFQLEGKQYSIYTHILSYRIHKGKHPKGRPHTIHRCDYPPCGNPAHIFAGNPKINSMDMLLKGRGKQKTIRPIKPRPPRVKRVRFTPEQTATIRARRKEKGINIYDMGFMLGMEYTRYYRMEHDEPTCTVEQMHFILRYLDLPEESLGLKPEQFYEWGRIGLHIGSRRQLPVTPPVRVYRKNSPVAVERDHMVWNQFANPRIDLFRADLIQTTLKTTHKQIGLVVKESGITRSNLYSLLNGHLTKKTQVLLPVLIEYAGLTQEQVMPMQIAA